MGETRDLIRVLTRSRVSDARVVCVVGASGSGESSVVRAGVLPPSAAQLQALRQALTRMARLGDRGSVVGHPILIDSVAPAISALVNRFVDERLLVTRDNTLEVAHEALFRAWNALRGWLKADRRFLAWQRDTAAPLRAYVDAGRDIEAVHLSGQALMEAHAWLASHRDAMGSDDKHQPPTTPM